MVGSGPHDRQLSDTALHRADSPSTPSGPNTNVDSAQGRFPCNTFFEGAAKTSIIHVRERDLDCQHSRSSLRLATYAIWFSSFMLMTYELCCPELALGGSFHKQHSQSSEIDVQGQTAHGGKCPLGSRDNDDDKDAGSVTCFILMISILRLHPFRVELNGIQHQDLEVGECLFMCDKQSGGNDLGADSLFLFLFGRRTYCCT